MEIITWALSDEPEHKDCEKNRGIITRGSHNGCSPGEAFGTRR